MPTALNYNVKIRPHFSLTFIDFINFFVFFYYLNRGIPKMNILRVKKLKSSSWSLFLWGAVNHRIAGLGDDVKFINIAFTYYLSGYSQYLLNF